MLRQLDGEDLHGLPLERRKGELKVLLNRAPRAKSTCEGWGQGVYRTSMAKEEPSTATAVAGAP